MKVLDHEPYAWFLLEHEGALYLDAHCSHSFFDYSVLIKLSAEECGQFETLGRDYIGRLAYDIHYSAPAALGSTSPFRSRNLTRELGDAVSAAVKDWRGREALGSHTAFPRA
ncbi:hypothetical protein ASG47_01485 [Devosia sp. Leaf420]|uniref:hypothetical protein n=1 Tax=Devosia sp. Leaf420 TaxID=1736374 RepID=UPI000713F77E|nr:hypothetical protein [Devosia sp. Leaf420]KQT51590.1 hypothetical protein ASG47_01485 [Devosia sp. Leaf420]